MLVDQVLDIDLRQRQLAPVDQPQFADTRPFGFDGRRRRLFWQ